MPIFLSIVPGPGFDRIEAGLAAAAATQPARMAQMGSAARDAGMAAIRQVIPVRTGELRDAESASVAGGNPTTVLFTNDSPHHRYVVEGRGPIHAINAKALRFSIGGAVLFRKSVGPAAANDYPARALAILLPQLQAIGVADAATIAAEIAS